MIRMAVQNVRYDFEEFVDENEDAGEDDYEFASAGQGSGLDRACLGGMWISVTWGIMKIYGWGLGHH